MTNKEAYDKGFIDGLKTYAWNGKDGLEVGTCGTKLKDAVNNREKSWNYSLPIEPDASEEDKT